jgi:hypothetical protein
MISHTLQPSRDRASWGRWLPWVLAIVAFWLSSSLLLDLLVMPVMYTTGMMQEPGFAAASYSLFEVFNHMELLCAGLVLTGLLALRCPPDSFGIVVSGSRCRWAVSIGVALFGVVLLYIYGLTPAMGAQGIQLDVLGPAATPHMDGLHGLYWGLECVKLAGLSLLVRFCYRDLRQGLSSET